MPKLRSGHEEGIEMKHKIGERVVIRSKTSHNNGKVVTVVGYSKGIRNDIVRVSTRGEKQFSICESSIFKATIFDEIRNFNDSQLSRLLPGIKRLSKLTPYERRVSKCCTLLSK